MEPIIKLLQEAVTPRFVSDAYSEAFGKLVPYLEQIDETFPPKVSEAYYDASADLSEIDKAETFALGLRTGAALMLELFPTSASSKAP